VPVILSSRADSLASRVLSAAVAVIFAGCPGAAGLYPAGRRQVAEA